jgi:hypothetical protein
MLSLNKYQALFVGCIVFLLFISFRSYAPFPDYGVPMTQVVKDRPFPDSEVSVEALLAAEPSWLGSNRDAFSVHDTYAGKVKKATTGTVDNSLLKAVPVMTVGDIKHPKPKKRPVIDQLASVDRIKVERPAEPKVTPQPPAPTPPKTGGVPPKPPASAPPTPAPAAEPPKPYELPFQLQGIVRADEEKGPFVILIDKQTGKRVRRYEGQKFQGVHIRKIGPGTVEVEVPDEGLELRYADTIHKWLPL